MKRFFTYLQTELKLSLRDMNMPIFVVIMPLIIFIILGIIYGTKPAYDGADYTFLEQSFGAVGAIAICASGLMGLPLAVSGLREIRLEPGELRIDGAILGRILRIGVPAGIQSAVFAAANIVIQSAINSLGTVVMAASSAAFNIEVMTYYVLNSFSQACTTFVGQNFGAGELKRCKRTLALSLAEGIVALGTGIFLVLFFGRTLLAIFNSDPEVVETGYTRLMLIMMAHAFSLVYEVVSGYLRGFGISLMPALLTMLGVCGIRLAWVRFVFPLHRTFRTIMIAFPISLAATAGLMLLALLYYRPSRRFASVQRKEPEKEAK